ncbi:carotenoid biosynthesis protein [Mycobacterium sp. PS03-16]|nr:carotenoid biosynthesis protein [Mycobacterium sp. PS03-16]
MPESLRTQVTVTSVVVFFLAAVADAARVHGAGGAALLVAVAGGGGLIAEAVGVAAGWPFGGYSYTGTLGPQVFGVPLVVPLAWVMMAWPALVVGRTLAARPVAVVAVGAVALAAWDVFLDPQMVAAGHWLWFDPSPTLPLIPEIPLSNYVGWLLVSAAIIATLHARLPRHDGPSAPAATLYLWVYFSSVLGHAVFFGLPGSAVMGGLIMGAVAVPFGLALLRRRERTVPGAVA